MKRTLVASVVLLGACLIGAQAQQSLPPTLPFESVPEPLKLPPDMNLGEVAGVAVNSKGRTFVTEHPAHVSYNSRSIPMLL